MTLVKNYNNKPINKPVQQELKERREAVLNQMSTAKVAWYLAKRHAVFLWIIVSMGTNIAWLMSTIS